MVSPAGDIILPQITRVVSHQQILAYAEASGDHNPLHLDPDFAARSQFGGVIAHGMLTLAFISEMLTSAFGRSWLETGKLKVRLKAPAYPGDQVYTWGRVVKDEIDGDLRSLVCAVGLNDSHDKELIVGEAALVLPVDLKDRPATAGHIREPRH